MDCRGTVQGEAARIYAGYTYLKPVDVPFDILAADPDRLHWASEYPRRVSKPSPPDLPMVELADYVVRFVDNVTSPMSNVQIWMQPNEYTAAREPMLVGEFHVASWLMSQPEYIALADRKAFRDVKPTPSRD